MGPRLTIRVRRSMLPRMGRMVGELAVVGTACLREGFYFDHSTKTRIDFVTCFAFEFLFIKPFILGSKLYKLD